VLPIRFATFLYFGHNQHEIFTLFLCLILKVLLATAGPWDNTFSVMLRGLSEWRGMVMFIESVVAEKESVTNIDRQLKNVYGVTAVSRWAHKFQVLRKVG
jgi:hypothetical protein